MAKISLNYEVLDYPQVRSGQEVMCQNPRQWGTQIKPHPLKSSTKSNLAFMTIRVCANLV